MYLVFIVIIFRKRESLERFNDRSRLLNWLTLVNQNVAADLLVSGWVDWRVIADG